MEIEIIIEEVEMPELDARRFQKHPKDLNGNKWKVVDTLFNKIRYEGKYEEASLVCHNLNKKFYKTITNGNR